MHKVLVRRKQANRSGEARRKILAATVELIAVKGVDGFSLAEVGERAGVSRALPGHHFKSRDQLVGEAVRGLLRPVGRPSEGGFEQLLSSFENSLAKVGSVRVGALMVILAAPSGRSPALAAIPTYWQAAEQFVEDHLCASISAGEVKGDLDPVATARTLVAAVYGEALIGSSRGALEAGLARAEGFILSMRRLLTPDAPATSTKASGRRLAVTPLAPKPPPKAPKPHQSDLFGADVIHEGEGGGPKA